MVYHCVSIKEEKLWGLETHDSHILLPILLPTSVRAYLRKDVSTTIVELRTFFHDIGVKTIHISELAHLQPNCSDSL